MHALTRLTRWISYRKDTSATGCCGPRSSLAEPAPGDWGRRYARRCQTRRSGLCSNYSHSHLQPSQNWTVIVILCLMSLTDLSFFYFTIIADTNCLNAELLFAMFSLLPTQFFSKYTIFPQYISTDHAGICLPLVFAVEGPQQLRSLNSTLEPNRILLVEATPCHARG